MTDNAAPAAPPAIPFVKEFPFEYGVVDQMSPLVRRVIARNPGPFTYTGSGTYIIGRGAVAVIDPGPENDDHRIALSNILQGETVSHILITHTHRDHCGGARTFADAVGAPIYGFGPHPKSLAEDEAPALEEGADYNYAPDHLLDDGAVIHGPGWTVDAVHTPGHISNHLCFGLREEKALFTGDHVMGWATTVIIPPDGHMGDYFNSLEKLIARDDNRYYPTHGAPIDQPQRFARAIRTHRRIRDGQILQQLRDGKTRIREEMVPAMYADIDSRLHGAAALNVLAHLIRLVETDAAQTDGGSITLASRFSPVI